MDMTRMLGTAAVFVGLILLAYTWQMSGVTIEPLAATIGGYARNTVLLGLTGAVVFIGGCAAFMMGKTTA
jgi:hypothetical protein